MATGQDAADAGVDNSGEHHRHPPGGHHCVDLGHEAAGLRVSGEEGHGVAFKALFRELGDQGVAQGLSGDPGAIRDEECHRAGIDHFLVGLSLVLS